MATPAIKPKFINTQESEPLGVPGEAQIESNITTYDAWTEFLTAKQEQAPERPTPQEPAKIIEIQPYLEAKQAQQALEIGGATFIDDFRNKEVPAETTPKPETHPVQPQKAEVKSSSLVDFGFFFEQSQKAIKPVKTWFLAMSSLLEDYVLFKAKEPKTPEELEKERKKSKMKNAFHSISQLLRGPSAEQRRALKDRAASINKQRKAKNESDETVLDSSGQVLRPVEIEVERISAEEQRRQQMEQRIAVATKSNGPQRGAKVQAANLELIGGNGRVRGHNATG